MRGLVALGDGIAGHDDERPTIWLWVEDRSVWLQPRVSDHARNLFADQPLDDAGKMFIKPGLQHRPQHVANHVLKRTVGPPERKLSLPASLAWQRAELGKSGCRNARCRRRKDAVAAEYRPRFDPDLGT
jgi:hypothetical protein